ncbi:hypothetical protein OTU49_008559 [Cherax quadricarinatus]|uniref:Uncharacterized protein n=1 Tax=Cherax quadricarinatus TaxID=27406 RepID=A0AAW0WQP9_CHEQU
MAAGRKHRHQMTLRTITMMISPTSVTMTSTMMMITTSLVHLWRRRPLVIILKSKGPQNPPQWHSSTTVPSRPSLLPPAPYTTTTTHSDVGSESASDGGSAQGGGSANNPAVLAAGASSEAGNATRPQFPLPKDTKNSASTTVEPAVTSFPPEKTDHEYEIVDVPARAFSVYHRQSRHHRPCHLGTRLRDGMRSAAADRTHQHRK